MQLNSEEIDISKLDGTMERRKKRVEGWTMK